jgi:hypothetical protein
MREKCLSKRGRNGAIIMSAEAPLEEDDVFRRMPATPPEKHKLIGEGPSRLAKRLEKPER